MTVTKRKRLLGILAVCTAFALGAPVVMTMFADDAEAEIGYVVWVGSDGKPKCDPGPGHDCQPAAGEFL